MAFQIGPVARSLRGWGFPVKGGDGVLIIYVEFEGHAEAERGAAAMSHAIYGAARIRDVHGREWLGCTTTSSS